jgi:hypothetical protein
LLTSIFLFYLHKPFSWNVRFFFPFKNVHFSTFFLIFLWHSENGGISNKAEPELSLAATVTHFLTASKLIASTFFVCQMAPRCWRTLQQSFYFTHFVC